MNIAEIFIKRPIMTSLVMFAILFAGLVGYKFLPVSDLPNVDFPTILVNAQLPGATPETMASSVATPLERQFSTIAGLDSMTSTSAQGVSQITLQFSLDRNIDAAAQDVQSMISQAARQLPADMPTPPSFRKSNPADQPVLYLAVSSTVLPLYKVHEYADTFIAQRISMINGVAQVQVFGAQKYAVRAQLDPKALASRKIGIDEVAAAVAKGNVNLPTGTLQGQDKAFSIQATGQLNDANSYRPLIVAYRNGNPVRLEELGRVIDSVENDKIAAWYTGTRGIVLAIQRQPGTNTVEIVKNIKKILPTLREQIPGSVDINTLYDRSVSIKESVADVQFTLFLAVCLVVLVIFLFLRNLSATVIPSLALPFSLVGTFSVMHLLGYSIDNFSLMALTLAVGFVVDDAIVMLENIVRHMEKGEGPLEAAFKGAKEIGFTILSMTLSLVAVFIPVLFLGGILGRLMHEFAVTISVAILVSGFVSLSLTPMLCSRFIKPQGNEQHGKLYQMSERAFQRMLDYYEKTLTAVLRHRRATMVFTGILVILTGALFYVIPKGFLPTDDTGQLFGSTEAQQGISFESMKAHQTALMEIVKKNPNVDGFMSAIGPSGISSTGNSGRMFMKLKPHAERELGTGFWATLLRPLDGYIPLPSFLRISADELAQKLRPQVSQVPGIQMFIQNMPAIRIGGRISKSLYQFTLQNPDTEELYKHATAFEAKMAALPILQDVTSDLQIKNPQINIVIDRDKASALGVSAQQIEEALQTAYSARQVSTIFAPSNQYQVIMELEPQYQRDPAALSLLYIRSTSGALVPIDAVASLKQDLGPLTVNHSGQFPSVTISFNTRPDVSLGEAVDAVNKLARESLPLSISTSFQGSAQAFQDSFRGLWVLLALAIIVIYIVLGILYESYIHPITILSGLPAAGFGALLTLFMFRLELNVYSFVGLIMLIGIVKKNAIMMIDFALEAQRNEGKSAHDAIYQGCIVRFRPIMMTTMAALMGTLPIALGLGAGAESRRPLGLAVVGGLLFSQIVTLYITPVFYLYMEKYQNKYLQWRAERKARAAGAHMKEENT